MLTRKDFILGGLAVVGCSSTSQNDQYLRADEYAILHELWNDVKCCQGDKCHAVVLDTLTVTRDKEREIPSIRNQSLDLLREKAKFNFQHSLIEDLYSVNKSSVRMDSTKMDTPCATFVTENEMERILKNYEAENELRLNVIDRIQAIKEGRTPPAPIIIRKVFRFSRFAFDSSNQEAIGVSQYFCGRLCAGEDLILARKKNAKWYIAEKIRLWSS
ncbi:MAG: hypothetical protein V3V30_05265 [Parvularculaceae bacterium]